jgi:hypothetical protein
MSNKVSPRAEYFKVWQGDFDFEPLRSPVFEANLLFFSCFTSRFRALFYSKSYAFRHGVASRSPASMGSPSLPMKFKPRARVGHSYLDNMSTSG